MLLYLYLYLCCGIWHPGGGATKTPVAYSEAWMSLSLRLRGFIWWTNMSSEDCHFSVVAILHCWNRHNILKKKKSPFFCHISPPPCAPAPQVPSGRCGIRRLAPFFCSFTWSNINRLEIHCSFFLLCRNPNKNQRTHMIKFHYKMLKLPVHLLTNCMLSQI